VLPGEVLYIDLLNRAGKAPLCCQGAHRLRILIGFSSAQAVMQMGHVQIQTVTLQTAKGLQQA
jgi:hypothetical protein